MNLRFLIESFIIKKDIDLKMHYFELSFKDASIKELSYIDIYPLSS